MKFSDFALRPEILQAVSEAGYEIPTPIQEQAIPVVLAGNDLLGIAQTGTGKTAAFVLPMIERLASGRPKARMPRSLIISPTRELATQSANYFETYGKYLKLKMALLIGGVGMDEQWRLLERGVDVLIVTPGRLLDQFERGKVLLGGVSILVIDEADRMLDMGFMPDVERIVSLLGPRRQTMMFSATMPPEIRRMASAFLTNPTELQAAPPATTADRIADHLITVPPRQKFKMLRRLIETQKVGKAIVFCNRKREVASLRRQLDKAGFNVRDIHGDLDQAQRTDALEAFKRGEVDFLVATDVAARGLDIAMLPCVINYDIPTHADDYVHRIGRTGRAGQEGRAFTLALPDEGRFIDAIAKLTGRVIPRLDLAGLDATATTASSSPEPTASGSPEPTASGSPEPTVPSSPEPKAAPARGRRRSRTATAEPVTAQEPAAPVPERADDTTADQVSKPRSRSRSRSRRGAEEAATAKAKPAARDQTRNATTKRRREAPKIETPIVGMGDHTPLFMLRPVPGLSELPELDGD